MIATQSLEVSMFMLLQRIGIVLSVIFVQFCFHFAQLFVSKNLGRITILVWTSCFWHPV